jgi:hypothetical protein
MMPLYWFAYFDAAPPSPPISAIAICHYFHFSRRSAITIAAYAITIADATFHC